MINKFSKDIYYLQERLFSDVIIFVLINFIIKSIFISMKKPYGNKTMSSFYRNYSIDNKSNFNNDQKYLVIDSEC